VSLGWREQIDVQKKGGDVGNYWYKTSNEMNNMVVNFLKNDAVFIRLLIIF